MGLVEGLRKFPESLWGLVGARGRVKIVPNRIFDPHKFAAILYTFLLNERFFPYEKAPMCYRRRAFN